ncbi:MAG: DHH family phosphoesterase [Bacilli bacterium]|nr:DHH family phosphoesterase [Bacilli bacterium]
MNFLDKLLDYYNISLKEYNELKADASLANVPSFNVFENMDIVKDKILEAIKNKRKILIYGDYDADGILATSILVQTFKKLKYEVDYYVPSRYLDGYGITAEKVIKAKEKGYDLIITVDNGVVAYEAIKKAKEIGIDMIITDHHEYEKEITEFLYLHPKKSKLKCTTSGAMVAFYLSTALLYEIDPYLLTLGATSILSDVMPLIKENRDVVKLAIKYLNKYKFDKFNLLSDTFSYDETTLALKVIPKINAVGRIETKKEVNLLVKYFTSDSYQELVKIREYLNNVNERRKSLTLEITDNLKITETDAVVLKLDILSGLSGLIANRILSNNNLPVCIFSSEVIDGNIRGSIRSRNGFDVIKFINLNKNLFMEYGGHELAAGVVIKESNFNEFKDAFIKYAQTNKFIPDPDNILIGEDEINQNNYDIIRSFAPFGNQWREPTFLLKDMQVSRIEKVGNLNQHLSILLNNKNKVIGFNFPFHTLTNSSVDLIGKIKLNKYKNNVTANFLLSN